MESHHFFDFVKLDKEKAIARFRIAKLRQFFDVFVVLGLISWSSARVPPFLRATAAYAVEFSTYLFNHHVVFLIGNAIIVMLFLLCRQNEAAAAGGDDFYGEYAKHSDAAAAAAAAVTDLPSPSIGGGDEEKQLIVVCAGEAEAAACDCEEMAVTIEKARRQIKRFERTKSERLKRDIKAATLRRSETQNGRKSVSVPEIERLSSEEFRRTIDSFINDNWSTRKTKKYEMAY